jgi:hypothetical protein
MWEDMTLDPPGSIAVVGAGPLGIEAALYARYLGYDVTLIESIGIASSLGNRRTQPLPLPPDRCLSPLAVGALHSQYPSLATGTKPITVGQWIDEALIPLTETDLLIGRLKCPARVTEIQTIAIEPEEGDEEDGEDIPPDFRLAIVGADGNESLDAESVVMATGQSDQVALGFQTPAPYFFRVGESVTGHAEADFWAGLQQIVSIFAGLVGRRDLDLYRPRRN